MTKKLIFIDLDGTLLDDDFHLSSFSKEIIQAVTSQGHTIILASGRPWRAIKPFYDELELKTPIIAYNGTYVFNPKDESFPILKKTFSKEEMEEILNEIDFPLLNVAYEDDKKLFMSHSDPFLLGYFPIMDMGFETGDPKKSLEMETYNFVFECLPKYDENLRKIIEKHSPILWRHWTVSKHSELYFDKYDKGSAARYIADKLGFEREDIIAFGDSTNDLTMLTFAKVSYCVLPCKSQLLLEKVAHLEKSNSEDAVAYKLQEMFL